jgi:hypothetical protein
MECNYCKKILSSKSSLNYHQKNAKYCLKIRRKTCDNYLVCKWCDKKYTRKQDFHRHVCKKKDITLINQNKILISNLEETITSKDESIVYLKAEVSTLQKELAIYKKLSESSTACVEAIAKQPHIQNTQNIQNNKWVNVTPFNLLHDEKEQEKLKGLFEEYYGEDHFYEGQRGIARFAHQHLLKDSTGNTKYRCTDSRNNFKYKNSNGDICKDHKAVKLAQLLGDSVRPITKSMLADLSDGMDSDELLHVIRNYQEINGMENDNGKFRAELRTLISE